MEVEELPPMHTQEANFQNSRYSRLFHVCKKYPVETEWMKTKYF